jgi:hypothetical protein
MTYGFQPLQGIPPNFSVLAAMSAGLLPANIKASNTTGTPGESILSQMSYGGAIGSNVIANTSQQLLSVSGGASLPLRANMPESALTTATIPNYAGA